MHPGFVLVTKFFLRWKFFFRRSGGNPREGQSPRRRFDLLLVMVAGPVRHRLLEEDLPQLGRKFERGDWIGCLVKETNEKDAVMT